MLAALRRACELTGVQLREHAPVGGLKLADGVRPASATATQPLTATPSAWSLPTASACAPSRSCWPPAPGPGELAGLPEHARMPVRPVKGQILRLRDPAGPGLLTRTVRFEGGYLVPRGDGRYVLGATVEERGFEQTPTAGGVYELLRDAAELVPGVWRAADRGARRRAASRHARQPAGDRHRRAPGLVWATGHYRNGILLAPLTAALLADMLAGGRSIGDGSSSHAVAASGSADTSASVVATAQSDQQLLAYCSPARFSAGDQSAGAPEPSRPPVGAY